MSKQLMSKGWDDMKSRLDNEMPRAKRKRRTVLFFWLFIGALSGIGSYYYLSSVGTESNINIHQMPIKTIANTDPHTKADDEIISNSKADVVSSNIVNTGDNSLVINKISSNSPLADNENASGYNYQKVKNFKTNSTKSNRTNPKSKEILTTVHEVVISNQNVALYTNNTPSNFDKNNNSIHDENQLVLTPDLYVANPVTGRAGVSVKDTETASSEEESVYKLDFLPSILSEKLVSLGYKLIDYPVAMVTNRSSNYRLGLYLGAGNSFGKKDMQTLRLGLFLNQFISTKFSLQLGADLGYVRTDFYTRVNTEVLYEDRNATIKNFSSTAVAIEVDNMLLANLHAKALYRISSKWSLLGGIEVSRLLGYKRSSAMLNSAEFMSQADLVAIIYDQVNNNIVNKWDILPVVGVQFDLSNRVGLELNYALGIQNIFDQSIIALNTQKRRELSLLGKYIF